MEQETDRTRAILRALTQVAPPVIRAHSTGGPCCILATRVGQQALAVFGIAATPFPVVLSICNDAWIRWGEDGYPGGTAEQLRRGAHLITNTPDWHGQSMPSQNPARSRPWDGHLVLRVDTMLIDLDLGAMSRPQNRIVLPATIIAPLTDDERVSASYGNATQAAHLLYYPLRTPDAYDYALAGDWTADVRGAVAEVVAGMRAQREEDLLRAYLDLKRESNDNDAEETK
jgi:hypothetical protein